MKEVTFREALELAEINYDSVQYIVLVYDENTGRTAFVAGGPIPVLLSGIDAMREAILERQQKGLN